jgi:hypothetical protein
MLEGGGLKSTLGPRGTDLRHWTVRGLTDCDGRWWWTRAEEGDRSWHGHWVTNVAEWAVDHHWIEVELDSMVVRSEEHR